MDYSQGNRHLGNTDLTREVVDRYYRAFPGVIGFINGYGTARTFDLRDGKPMISYDYYLDLQRPADQAAADLDELIRLNNRRPYFLLMHVRERNTVEKVNRILGMVSEPVEVVPLDLFLKQLRFLRGHLDGDDRVGQQVEVPPRMCRRAALRGDDHVPVSVRGVDQRRGDAIDRALVDVGLSSSRGRFLDELVLNAPAVAPISTTLTTNS